MSINPDLTLIPGHVETTGNIVTGIALFTQQIFGESAATSIGIENTLNIRNAGPVSGNITFDGAILINGTSSFGFVSSVAIGKNTRVLADYSIAIGSSDTPSEGAFVYGISGIAIGHTSNVYADESIAIGAMSLASAPQTVSIGMLSSATALHAIALGNVASASAHDTIAIGEFSQATSGNGIAVGASSITTSGENGVAIGSAANATNINAIAIGGSSTANNLGTIALGSSSSSTGTQSIAIGRTASASNNKSIAAGNSSVSSAAQSIALGNAAIASATRTMAISYDAQASALYGIAIGTSSRSLATDGIAIGRVATARGSNSISIGLDTGGDATTGADNIAIGQSALTAMNNVSAAFNVALGYRAGRLVQTGYRNTLAGSQAGIGLINGKNNVCLGPRSNYYTDSNTIRCIAIGMNAASGNSAVAIGVYSTARPTYAIAIGGQARARGANSVSIGRATGGYTSGDNNIAIGQYALAAMNNVAAAYNVAVGKGAGIGIQEGEENSFFGLNAGQIITSGSYNTCIGAGANGYATNTTKGVAIGVSAVTGNSNVAIGGFSSATGGLSVAVGFGATAKGSVGVSIGYNAGPDVSTGSDNISIGQSVMVGMTGSASNRNIGVGSETLRFFTSGTHLQNVAIGYLSMAGTPGGKTANTQYNVCFGSKSGYILNGGNNNVFIGQNAGDTMVTGTSCVCVGRNSDVFNSTRDSGISIGVSAICGTSVVAIGESARAYATQSMALGRSSYTNGVWSTVIGNTAVSTIGGSSGIAIGPFTYINSTYAIAIGGSASPGVGPRVTASSGIAIGRRAIVAGTRSIAIGVLAANSSGSYGIAIGVQAYVTQNGGIAIGRLASSGTGAYGIAIGRSSATTASKSVALGFTASNSVANTAVLAPSGGEVLRTLDPSVGNFSYRTVKSTVSESPAGFFVPTVAQLVGGYISVVPSSASQPPPIAWIKQQSIMNSIAADNACNCDVDSAGNLYVVYASAGTVSGGTLLGSTDIVLFKLDPNGNLLWIKEGVQFNTIGADTVPDVAVAPSGNIFVVFNTAGTVSGGTSLGGTDCVVAKFDTNGNMLWIRQSALFNSTNLEQGATVAVDPSDNCYLASKSTGTVSGGTNISTAGLGDVYVAKFDLNGTLQWIIQTPAFNTTANEGRAEIEVDSNGNSYICYSTSGTISGGTNIGGNDIVVFKLNTSGTLQWTRQTQVFNTVGADGAILNAQSISVHKSTGDVYVTYQTDATVSGGTFLGGTDIVLFKLDTNGTHQWNTQSSLINTTLAEVQPYVSVDGSNNVYIVYTTTGTVSGGTNIGGSDMVISKFNSSGTQQWIMQTPIFNNTLDTTTPRLIVFSTGIIYVVYSTSGTISGGTNFGSSDIVAMKFSATDVGVLAIGSNGGVTGTNLSTYAQIAGNAYVGLTFRCIVQFAGNSLLAISGTTGVTVNGITPIGNTAALNTPRELIFINTGTNTWDMFIHAKAY